MIKANFSTYATYVTDSLYQWDINQTLSVTGLNLTAAPEVHFANGNMDRAIVRQATITNHVVNVEIPNSLLQDPLRIYAYIGVYEGKTFKVVETVEIPVIPRKRPLDYQIEDSDGEIYSFKALEAALGDKASNARVDNIIAHNNDTAGNSELVDIRTDADDIVHDSAGEAMRANMVKRLVYIEDDLNAHLYNMVGLAAATAANNPTGETAIVTFDRANTSWDIQRVYSFYGDVVYWRTHRKGTWSDWHRLSDGNTALYVDAGEDMNGVLPDRPMFGVCHYGAFNTPETGQNGLVEFLPFSTGTNTWYLQRWYDTTLDTCYVRRYRLGVWTEWKQMSGGIEQKTVVFMGDSILGNNQTSTGVVNIYASLTGHTCHNFALGGTRAKSHTDEWAAWDSQALSQAIVSGDFSAQEAALDSITTEPAYFAETIAKMKDFDFSTADILVINWGTNDWAGGTDADDYYAALDTFVSTMLSAYPNLVIIKMTPTQRFMLNASGEYESGNTFKSAGVTLQQFVEADKRLTEEYNLQVIDAFNIGINAANKHYFFDSGDYTHQNAEGRKRVASVLAAQIK